MANNYNVLVGVELDTKNVQSQLDKMAKNKKINIDTKSAQKNVEDLGKAIQDTSIEFNAASEIFRRSIDVIETMVDQVVALDSALVEFQKVSELSGQALEDYTAKLSKMGREVARTGKPKCLAPCV